MLSLMLAVMGGGVPEESYRAGDREFPDCASARAWAEAQPAPVRVSCRYEAELGAGRATAAQAASTWSLKALKPVGEFELTDRDASAVTFLDAKTVLISFQDFLEIRDLDGKVLASIGPVDGDIEGLERQGERIIAVDERGSRREELTRDGLDVEHVTGSALPQAGLECVAHDPATGGTWYGQDSSGKLYDGDFEVVLELGSDLSACTVHEGRLVAVTSDEWRDSFWYLIDLGSFEILEQAPLPRGNWEGVACHAGTCVLVQEASEASPAAMLVLERDSS